MPIKQHSKLRSAGLLAWIVGLAIPAAFGAEPAPFAKVRPLELDATHWISGFWAERFDSLRTNTLPSMIRLMEDNQRSQFFRNFEIAAGLAEGDYRGASFKDGDFYKLLEAECATYAVTRDPGLDEHLDRVIAVIAKAQRADGYLHTPVLIGQRKGDPKAVPFCDRNNFEVYNMGHLLTTACIHHRATGKTSLLAVATKAADFLAKAFANPTPEQARNSICPSHYMGMIDLYRETGESRYLAAAKGFFAIRDLVAKTDEGGDDNQDRVPFLKQAEAVGHAVRANYLFAGAADLFAETGNPATWQMLERVWKNVVQEKLYITGACGALYDGASPDGSKDQKHITRTHQAYGRNYQLPNTTAHSETCANIGNVLWNWRMFLNSGDARFMDVLELALYNSVLCGVGLAGTNFFYSNPLRVTDPMPVNLRWSRTRVPYVSSFCCPPNVARTIAEASTYAYARSPRTLWVNLYGSSTVATPLDGAGRVKLTQETQYPWNGRARITVSETEGGEFTLKLRIPEWSGKARLRINQRPEALEARPGSYAALTRRWKPGDVLELDLLMEPRLIEANPLVEETLNQLAVKRGPIVYCLESADLPEGIRVGEVSLPPDMRLTALHDGRLLGGVVALHGSAEARKAGDWNGRLYRDVQLSTAIPVKIRLVPYYAWGNRGQGEMTVWLPRTR